MKVGFRLINIKNNQFAFDDIVLSEEDLNKIEVNISSRFGIQSTNRVLGCIMNVQFSLIGKKIIYLESQCNFQLTEDYWLSLIDSVQSIIIFPTELLQHLGVITFGTMRGILFEKLQGSDYEIIQLPLVNLTEIIVNQEKFDLKENE